MNKSKRILSLYNSLQNTYSTIVNNNPLGLELQYISTINSSIEYDSKIESFNEKSIEEFRSQFEEIVDQIDEIAIVFPADLIMVSQFPFDSKIPQENIKSLLDIEIKKAYPTLNINDFTIHTYTLEGNINQPQTIMCVIIPNIEIHHYKEFFQKYNKKIISANVSQISAANCFFYNYPEYRNITTAIAGIQGNFIDFTVIANSKILYYNLLSYQQNIDIPQILLNEISKAQSKDIKKVDNGLFCYGDDLTNDLFSEITESLRVAKISCRKLNAFRMMRTNLGNEEIEYCKRSMHIFPPVIGSTLPPFFESSNL
ncbi:MAG TPA: hypothetical protein DCW42_05565 [Bacteroidetes bacterium]|nr:hypothetical protein [Bacteroidota bacterium]